MATLTQQLTQPKETLELAQQRVQQFKNRAQTQLNVGVQTTKERGIDLGLAWAETSLKITRRWAVASKLKGPANRIQTAMTRVHEKRKDVKRPAIADYDALTVKQVVTELGKLDTYNLTKTLDYEKSNKNRKTVIEAIEKRFA